MCQMFAGQNPANYQMESRSLRLNGYCTSIRLEKAFWAVLDQIAEAEDKSTPQFISTIHNEVIQLYGEARNFTSLLRCCCTVYLEKKDEAGSARDGFPDQDLKRAV